MRGCHRLQLAKGLQRRHAHVWILLLELGDDGGRVLRERRRLQLSQGLHRRLAHLNIGVLELGDNAGRPMLGVLQLINKRGAAGHTHAPEGFGAGDETIAHDLAAVLSAVLVLADQERRASAIAWDGKQMRACRLPTG